MIPTNVHSFQVDHTALYSGIYKAVEGDGFTTWDLRFTSPALQQCMTPEGAHSLEHLLAVWFRNSSISEHVIALDGMMCLTGFYLIVSCSLTPYSLRDLLLEALDYVISCTEVPAATVTTCGNYRLHSLDDAKCFALSYRESLLNSFCCDYTYLE